MINEEAGYARWKKQQQAATIPQMLKAKDYNYGELFYNFDIDNGADTHRDLWETLYKKEGDPAYPWMNDKTIVTDQKQFMLGFMYGTEMLLSTLIFWLDCPEEEPEDDQNDK